MNERQKAYFSKKIGTLGLLIIAGAALYISSSGTIYGYMAFLGIMVFFLRDEIKFKEVISFHRKMSLMEFLMFLCLSLSIHFIGTVFNEILNPILAAFSLKGGSTLKEFFVTDVIYYKPPLDTVILSGFICPLLEEIICRGYIMGSFYHTSESKIYAILFSSIIFGGFHCDFIYFIPFSIGGIWFGYVAMEYGIWWSAIYHSINNFLIAEILNHQILMNMPEKMRIPIYLSISAFFMVCSIAFLIINRKEIHEYISENMFKKEHLTLTLTSPVLIVFALTISFFTLIRLDHI